MPQQDAIIDDLKFKYKKTLPIGMSEELDSMSDDDLKRRIIDSEVNIKTHNIERSQDEDLTQAKDRVKELEAPYKDAIKTQKAIVNYATLMLDQ